MFDVTAWLEKNAYGYKCLSDNERQAITGFSLLWGLFEARMLDGEAQARGESVNAQKIVEKCKNLCEPIGRVRECHFSDSLAYFRKRYTKDGETNLQRRISWPHASLLYTDTGITIFMASNGLPNSGTSRKTLKSLTSSWHSCWTS